MSTVTIEQAETSLSALIRGLAAGEEVVITQDDRPVARLVATPPAPLPRRRTLGTLSGSVRHVASDFDAPLDDFKEYTE